MSQYYVHAEINMKEAILSRYYVPVKRKQLVSSWLRMDSVLGRNEMKQLKFQLELVLIMVTQDFLVFDTRNHSPGRFHAHSKNNEKTHAKYRIPFVKYHPNNFTNPLPFVIAMVARL